METTIITSNGATAKLKIKDKSEHQQKCWLNGYFYEASKGGLLAYIMNHKERYEGKKCLDIGASIGNHTVYFGKILGCKVTSVEPVKSSFNHLKANCELNKIKPKLINVALGNKKKLVKMENMSKDKFNAGMYQVKEKKGTTKLEKIDTRLKGQRFDFIKIDVEHYNLELLAGGEKFFKDQVDCDVFIECEDKEILGRTNRIMKGYGYTFQLGIKLNHTPTYLWVK